MLKPWMGCFTNSLDVYPFVFILFLLAHMLKKLIASGSAAMVAMTSILGGFVVAAPAVTDPELIDAVSWGYDLGLTSYSDADAFMPYNYINREQAAKFFSEFGDQVLGLTADSPASCSFLDTASADSSLAASITKACQQGIMMGHAGMFMPKDGLTRGQLATVVSRMLGAIDPMSSEQAHFEYLNSQGIMNYANLGSQAKREAVILMLYRLANSSSTDLCAIDPSLPGCTPNPGGTGTVVKAGDLQISMGTSTPANLSSVPMKGSVKYGVVDFTAGSSDITINSVDLMRGGLGNPSDFSRLYFEKAGLRVSSRASVSTDNKAVISFAPSLVVKAGTTVSLDLYADMVAVAAGSENNFSSTAINSSAANVAGMIQTPTLRTANYTVATVTVTALGSNATVKADETNVELGQFKLANLGTVGSQRDVKFKSITLRQNGNGDIVASLKDLYLERNGAKVSSSYVVNGKDLTFLVSDTIKDAQNATYYIRGNIANVDNSAGDTYQFTLRNTTDLNATESITDFRTSVTPATSPVANLATITVNGGDVKFVKDPTFSLSNTYSAGTQGVVLMQGTITAKEAIFLEDITLTATTSTGAGLIAKRFYLSIGNSTFSWTPSNTGTSVSALFDGAVTINSSAAVKLWADIDTNAPAGATITFSSLSLTSFATKEYVSTQNTITSSVGSIQSSIANIAASKLSISRNDGLASTTTVVANSSDKLVYGVTLSNNQTNPIRVNALTIGNSAAGFNNNVDLTVYVNGVAASTKRYNGNTTFSSLNITVNKGTPVSVYVKADLIGVATGTAGAFSLTGTLDATDTISSNAASYTTLPIIGSIISVVDAGSVNVVQGTTTPAKLLESNVAGVVVGVMNVEARNDGMKLTDAYLSVSGAALSKFGAIRIVDGVNSYNGTMEGTTVKFEGMSVAIAANTTKSFNVIVDASTIAFSGDLVNSAFSITVATGYTVGNGATVGTINGMRLISDANGQPITAVAVVNPLSPTHKLVAGYPFFASAGAPTNNDVMVFSITPKGNKIRLQSLTYTAAGSAFVTGTGVLIQLKDVNNVILATGTALANGTLTLSTPVEIAAASTFKVYAPNYTKTINDSQRSFTITNTSFDQWTSSDGVFTNTPSIAGFENIVGLSSFTATY
jgi:hypothetical protein